MRTIGIVSVINPTVVVTDFDPTAFIGDRALRSFPRHPSKFSVVCYTVSGMGEGIPLEEWATVVDRQLPGATRFLPHIYLHMRKSRGKTDRRKCRNLRSGDLRVQCLPLWRCLFHLSGEREELAVVPQTLQIVIGHHCVGVFVPLLDGLS